MLPSGFSPEPPSACPAASRPELSPEHKVERLNSIEDFRALCSGRVGPPGSSRFAHAASGAEKNGAATSEVENAAAHYSDHPRHSLLACPSTPAKDTEKSDLAGPMLPGGDGPEASRLRARGLRNTGEGRRASDSGESPFMQEMWQRGAAQALGAGASQQTPATSLRRRRATDGGVCTTVMRAVVERRNLKHLAPGSEVSPGIWPSLPARKAGARRHTMDGSSLRGADDFDTHLVARRRHARRHTATPPVPEEGVMEYPEEGAGPWPSRQESLSYLESTALVLTSKLAEAAVRETALRREVEELRAAAAATPQAAAHQLAQLRNENDELRQRNSLLEANLARKTKVINSASAALPMVVNKAAMMEQLGPLRHALDEDGLVALLELLSLGAPPRDVHLMMLGWSETHADLNPFLKIGGLLHSRFCAAEEAENAVQGAAEEAPATGSPLTRGHMAQLLREKNVKQLLALGVDHDLVKEVALATLSGIDPWSIVNLLDGRVSRLGDLDMTTAPALVGVLGSADLAEVGLQSPVAEVLAKLARKCSLSPLKALREHNQELERNNTALSAQLDDLHSLMAVKQCKWTAEKAAPALSAELWRVDSFGSTAGLTSPATSSPSAKVA